MDAAMSNGDLLRKLFQSYKRRDDQAFTFYAQQVVEQERQKHHNILAQDLAEILDGVILRDVKRLPTVNAFSPNDLPQDKERGLPLVEIVSTRESLHDIILEEESQSIVEGIIREYGRIDVLRTHGLHPRRRLLFCGPPGCGKTLCAKVIAHELDLPLLYVRFDTVVSSYLGETSANLRKIFDFAQRGSWVLLFDEFDAIGKSRADASEHGELRRVVNSFLQLLDNFRSDNLVIAATNHEQMLDSALWRRFDDLVYFPPPDRNLILRTLERKLSGTRYREGSLNRLANSLVGATYADIERICLDAVKKCYLDNRNELTAEDLKHAVQQYKRRLRILSVATESEPETDIESKTVL